MARSDRLPRVGDHRGRQPAPHVPRARRGARAAAYDVPFCPQLPRLEGDMVGEWLGADPRRCGWRPARDRERPPRGTRCSPRSSAGRRGTASSSSRSRARSRSRTPSGERARARTESRRGWRPTPPHRSAPWRPRPRRAAGRRRAGAAPLGADRPSGTRCARSRPRGACTCAARCRGTSSSAPSPTCSRSTSRPPAATRACCGRLLARGGRSPGASSRRTAPSTRRTRCRGWRGTARRGAGSSLLTASCGSGRMSAARERDRHRAVGHGLRAAPRERDEVAARGASDC